MKRLQWQKDVLSWRFLSNEAMGMPLYSQQSLISEV